MMKTLRSKQAHIITVGDQRLPLIITKHPRAKSMVLRYDRRDHAARLTLPRYVSISRGIDFAISRTQWLALQIDHFPMVPFTDGAVIPLWGRDITLKHQGGRGVVTLKDEVLHVPGEAEFMTRRVQDYIRKTLRQHVQDIAERYANMLEVKIASIRIADTRSRWGSCGKDGDITLCLRLAFAPWEVLDYVVCHEVVHIKHHNHSKHFWRQVKECCPAYEGHEGWLAQHGQQLWRYG